MEKINFNFTNRTAIVTGGAQGFGLDIAKRFLNSGAKVIIWDIDPKMLEKATKDLNNSNLSSNIVDVSNYDEVESCANDILKNSNVDILINNAGITGPTAALWEYDVETWKKVVEINLMGTFNCCRAIVPNMIKNNYGRIVNVASVAGKDGNANASAYSVGKAGAIGLTKSLGKELGLYDNPYQYFGMLGAEMHRAIRLVVDTGLHSKGWTREEAIDYSLAHEARSEASIIAEVERYMANPGQALSYKIGQLKILELRKRAEEHLGEAFDIRMFHRIVLGSGPMPLYLLENLIDQWIASSKNS